MPDYARGQVHPISPDYARSYNDIEKDVYIYICICVCIYEGRQKRICEMAKVLSKTSCTNDKI